MNVRFEYSRGHCIIRVLAHDGGLHPAEDVTVNVTGSSTTSASVR